jgi:hypothetical protein
LATLNIASVVPFSTAYAIPDAAGAIETLFGLS